MQLHLVVAVHLLYPPESIVLPLKPGELAATATVLVVAIDAIDTKVRKVDITIPELFRRYQAVFTPYVQAVYFPVVVLSATVVKAAPVT